LFVVNIDDYPREFKEAWESLNVQQRMFCMEYIESMGEEPQYKIYLKVYKCKKNSAERGASNLLRNVKVLIVIKYLQESYFQYALTKLGLNKLSMVKDLDDIKNHCKKVRSVLYKGEPTGFMELSNPNAAILAIKEINNILKMEDQKREIKKKKTNYDESTQKEIDEIPTDPIELQKWHIERARKARQKSNSKS